MCYKVLHDHSVSESTRSSRAEALLIVGTIFHSKVVNEQEGLDELVTKLGRQSGLFDADDLHEKAARGYQPEDETKDDEGEVNWMNVKERLSGKKDGNEPAYSTKELKALIVQLGGDPNRCIEKSELEQYLTELVNSKLKD